MDEFELDEDEIEIIWLISFLRDYSKYSYIDLSDLIKKLYNDKDQTKLSDFDYQCLTNAITYVTSSEYLDSQDVPYLGIGGIANKLPLLYPYIDNLKKN